MYIGEYGKHLSAGAGGNQKRAADLLLDLWVFVSHPLRVLGTRTLDFCKNSTQFEPLITPVLRTSLV